MGRKLLKTTQKRRETYQSTNTFNPNKLNTKVKILAIENKLPEEKKNLKEYPAKLFFRTWVLLFSFAPGKYQHLTV